MDIVISPAGRDECEELARLETASFDADKDALIWPRLFPPASKDVLDERLLSRAQGLEKVIEEGKIKVITAKMNGTVVGWAEWVPPGYDSFEVPKLGDFFERFVTQTTTTRAGLLKGTRYWYLQVLVVDSNVWKRGIGRKLVQWGLDKAERDPQGPTDAFLEASLMGEAFYWKLGFKTLGWDGIREQGAVNDMITWPFMLKRGKSNAIADTSIKISSVHVEDCEKICQLSTIAFSVDSYTTFSRLRNPPMSEEMQASQNSSRIKHLVEQVDIGSGSRYIKAEVDNVIVGYAEWIPPGKDNTQVPQGSNSDLTFNQRFVGKIRSTRRRVMKAKRYWYLIELAVNPAFFGAGIGRLLVQWGLKQAMADDADCCYLETQLKNEAFYQKLGFRTLDWDSIEAPQAPDGMCQWPYMIREIKEIKEAR